MKPWSWISRRQRNRELEEEIQARLAMAKRDRVERGEMPDGRVLDQRRIVPGVLRRRGYHRLLGPALNAIRKLHACDVENGRHEIDLLNDAVYHLAAGDLTWHVSAADSDASPAIARLQSRRVPLRR